MKGTRLGPVVLDRAIGHGGMGTVYRARVLDPIEGCAEGDVVAVKVVHAHLEDEAGFVERFRREASVGQRIRHPHVVPTYFADTIEQDGQRCHFLVMKLVEGETLRDVAEELGALPESLLVEVGAQIASGLEAIHVAGIVHRDLKPENVILTPDHQVRIMDLGVARLLDDTVALTRHGQFAGSLLYAAPEQIDGQGIGPSADLYSLGVVLYELAAGRNPFRRDSSVAVIRAHLDDAPPRLDEDEDDLSPFFASVVDTLLAKRPGQRFASAGDLARTLEEGETSAWWRARAARVERTRTRRPQLPVRRETELYGRDEARKVLQSAWHEARTGRGGVVLCLGEAGIGKTRLVDAFLGEVAGEDAHVLYGSYPPSGGMGGLSDAVLDHLGTADLDARIEPLMGLGEAFAASMGSILRQAGAGPSTPDAIQTGMVALARGLAREKPLCWVVDDLHFAPAASRQIFLALARALTDERILLVGTARPGIPDEELAWLGRLERFRRIELGRLSPREVIQLLHDAFKSVHLAERLGGRIAYQSDGVPFFVFEMIRSLRDGEFIKRLEDGSYVESKVIDEIEVPSAVRDLIEARLGSLPPEERAMLDVAAVQGFEFDGDLIARVTERSRLEVLQTLAGLARRRAIIRSAGRRYAFDHHQIQEVLVDQISPALREEYHTLLATALEAREAGGGVPAPELHVELARHHLGGTHPERGLPYLDAALEHLGQTYRHEDYLALVEQALLVPDVAVDRRCRWQLGRAHRLGMLGRADQREEALGAALELAAQAADPLLEGRAHLRLFELLRHRGRMDEAERHLAEAEGFIATTEDADQRLSLLLHRSSLAFDRGQLEDARGLLEAMEALAIEVGDTLSRARAVSQLGSVLFTEGRVGDARLAMRRMLEVSRAEGDREAEVKALGNLGLMEVHIGHMDRARDHLEASLEGAREIGDRTGELYGYMSLGNLHDAVGNIAEARACHERALALARETGERVAEAIEEGNLGTVAFREGRLGAMLDRYQRTVRVAVETQDVALEISALGNLGQAWLAIGVLPEARRALEETIRRAREVGIPDPELYALAFLARIDQEEGLRDDARRHLAQAWRIARVEGQPRDVIEVLSRVAQHHLDEGREARARRLLHRTLELARRTEGVRQSVLTLCRLAQMEGVGTEEAVGWFEDEQARLGVTTRMEAAFLLWQATGDADYLRRAREDLAMLERGIPGEHCEAFGRSRELYRAVREATP